MNHLKIYESYRGNAPDSNNDKKYLELIYDKLGLDVPFGKIDIMENYFGKKRNGIRILIRIGVHINPQHLKSIIEFFEDCEGYIESPTSGEWIYYHLDLTRNFLNKLDVELDAKKYNL